MPQHGAEHALPDRPLALGAAHQAPQGAQRPRDDRPHGGDAAADGPEPAADHGRARDAGEEAGRLRGEQRGQHRQRADDGAEHDQDRADGEAGEQAVAAQEHAAHRDDHGQARDEHGASGRGRGDLDRVDGRLALGPFAALAGEVEDRVVDTDREADQEDHGLRHVGDGQQVAGEGREAAGGADRAHREQHRDAGRHEAAEREHQDQQRQRQRQGLGLLEVLALRLVVDLGERRLTGLADGEAGMGRGGGRGRGQCRCDLVAGRVLRAGDLEADQRGVTVGRDGALVVRGAQLLHVLGRREASHDVVDDGAELRVAGLQRRRGDDHLLRRLRAEARAVEGARRDAALPRAGLRRLQLLRAGHAADHDRQHDERDPAGNCLPRVPGTPGADGSRQSSLGIHYLRTPSPRRTCIA